MKKLVLVLGLLLAGCDGSGTSVGQIVATIQNTCGYVTTVNAIVPVVISVLSSFDPSAGAAATVSSEIASKVVEMVCSAVKSNASASRTGDGTMSVLVNGVRVPGHLVSK